MRPGLHGVSRRRIGRLATVANGPRVLEWCCTGVDLKAKAEHRDPNSGPRPGGWPLERKSNEYITAARILLLLSLLVIGGGVSGQTIEWSKIQSPVIFLGDEATAYRDPTAIYHEGTFYLYFTLVHTEDDGEVYSYTAMSKSRNLRQWTEPKVFTPRDRSLNFSSPGNVIRYGDEWILCLQTYPRPDGEKYGNATARIYTMRSTDLENWGPAELLKVKGPDVPQEKMGRMIDPYLIEDKEEPGKWWCFYKQNGVSWSWSRDLETWTFAGSARAGENACVVLDGNEYVLFHSPGNGIGVKRATDFGRWRDCGLITLGQRNWPWAQGRLTAGFVLDLADQPAVEKYLMLFHGSAYPENAPQGGFDNFASIGLAWSNDLNTWDWPGKDK
jgi:hypothetical protein